jgi:hypothetical protein
MNEIRRQLFRRCFFNMSHTVEKHEREMFDVTSVLLEAQAAYGSLCLYLSLRKSPVNTIQLAAALNAVHPRRQYYYYY